MKVLIIVNGRETKTQNTACLYRGVYDPKNLSETYFISNLVDHFNAQGWVCWISAYTLTEQTIV